MSIRINWTPEAEKTFNQNIEYLSKEWDAQVINRFLDRVDEVLQQIRCNTKLFPRHMPNTNIYRCVVHERIIPYYLHEDENNIDLLTFWNTSQDPNKLQL